MDELLDYWKPKYNPKYLNVARLTKKELLILLDKGELYCQGLFGSKAGGDGFKLLTDIYEDKLKAVESLSKCKNLWVKK